MIIRDYTSKTFKLRIGFKHESDGGFFDHKNKVVYIIFNIRYNSDNITKLETGIFLTGCEYETNTNGIYINYIVKCKSYTELLNVILIQKNIYKNIVIEIGEECRGYFSI